MRCFTEGNCYQNLPIVAENNWAWIGKESEGFAESIFLTFQSVRGDHFQGSKFPESTINYDLLWHITDFNFSFCLFHHLNPPPTPRSFCILGIQSKRSGAYFWCICRNIVFPKINRKIHVQRICIFLKWRMTDQGASRPSGGGCRRGGVSPFHTHHRVFALRGFKVSDLVHNTKFESWNS